MSDFCFFRLSPGLQNPIHAAVFAVILLLTKAVGPILDDICASAHSTTVGDRFLYHAIILSPLTIRPLPIFLCWIPAIATLACLCHSPISDSCHGPLPFSPRDYMPEYTVLTICDITRKWGQERGINSFDRPVRVRMHLVRVVKAGCLQTMEFTLVRYRALVVYLSCVGAWHVVISKRAEPIRQSYPVIAPIVSPPARKRCTTRAGSSTGISCADFIVRRRLS